MYSIEVIKSASFQNPTKLRDNFNRDCSICKSSAGFVIHSAALRSTAFVSVACDKPTHDACAFFHHRKNQKAINKWIECVMAGHATPDANAQALQAMHGDHIPGLVVRTDKYLGSYVADIPTAKLVFGMECLTLEGMDKRLSAVNPCLATDCQKHQHKARCKAMVQAVIHANA